MIAKEFPSAKDLHRIRGKSFVIMAWSPWGPQAGLVQRKGA